MTGLWLGLSVTALAADPFETEVKIGLACEDLGRFQALKGPKVDRITFFEKPDARSRVDLESERWKWDQEREEIQDLSKEKVSFERWSKVRSSGGHCLALEVSVRVETVRAEKAIAALQAFVVSKGVRIQPALQENKTARVLDLLLGRAR